MTATVESRRRSFEQLAQRLSVQSTTPGQFYEPFIDIPWDEPGYEIDPADPRWELGDELLLGRTDWYRSQPDDVRYRIGLHVALETMKAGLQFERVLQQGLLEFTKKVPDDSPALRYAYHEVVEEARHSLMFLELVRRAPIEVTGLARWQLAAGRRWINAAARRPELFFVFILVGEELTDYHQRRLLKREDSLPPILAKIMRIHVAEEARHVGFARNWLLAEAPTLSRLRRLALRMLGPLVVASVLREGMHPRPSIVRAYGIPKDVLALYRSDAELAQQRRDAASRIRSAFETAGLMTPVSRKLWQRLGLL